MENLHDILHGIKWIISHGRLVITIGPSKRGESYTKLGVVAIKLNCHWLLEILYCHVGEPKAHICRNPSTRPHGPLSIYISKFEGHQFQKIGILFPTALDLHVKGPLA
jgi:hypothetical protein